MENSIRRASPLVSSNVSSRDYTVSLLSEALRCGMVSQLEVERVQVSLLELMRRSVERLTHGQSTSVRTEKAQSILQSNLYTLDVLLLSCGDHETALRRLLGESMHSLFERSQALLRDQVEQCKALYSQAQATRLRIDLYAYNATADGIASFFKLYDPVFSAHETPADIDYPLAIDVSSLRGVFYMRQYLRHLLAENEFCAAFPASQWIELLRDCGAQYQTKPRDLMINLCECALVQSVLTVSLGKKAQLSLSAAECAHLQARLGSLDNDSLSCWLDGAIANVAAQTHVGESCATYLRLCRAQLLRGFQKALIQNALDRYAIVPVESAPQSLALRETHLDDKSLRALLRRLQKANNAREKADLLRARVHSFEDLADLLRADALSGQEYAVFFGQLSDLELAAFARRTFPAELRALDPQSLKARLHSIAPTGEPYADALAAFLRELGDVRLNAFERCMSLVPQED